MIGVTHFSEGGTDHANNLVKVCRVLNYSEKLLKEKLDRTDDDPALEPNCTINEVRISPCVEALENLPCKIKRGRSASIQFDFTPTVGSETLTGKVYWVNQMGDLPFVGMNSDACTFTTCPIQPDRRQTYEYQLSISKRFPVVILGQSFPELTEEERLYGCFQQDSATAHTAPMSMQALSDVSGNRIISSDIWSARSPDLNPRDFFFWGCLKDKVHNSNPRTKELKENIRREIVNIPAEHHQTVGQNFFRRCEDGLRVEEHHFQHFL
ncbi:hypothetical protein B7P43_G12809 [Cryptotermes secundus]|uniref:MD-2-related lipid-recognition domain-containing protein n=1 Tax=Cryptotermes secundus TaxID=105785 RepID=A0A2J7QXA2_9NEOP|nr:hypothetical protein B7P43_G12809 [Cryptotermes secundus]